MQILPIKSNNPKFEARERVFVMLKPDAFQRNLEKSIMTELLKRKGLSVSKSWDGRPSREVFERNWASKKGKSFFSKWMDYMVSGKVRGMIVEGDNAISKLLRLKKFIRDKYAPNEKRVNLIHSSDTVADTEYEIGNFFNSVL